jgi:hypothetical protein
MDFIDQIQALATKIHRQRNQLQTEESTRTPLFYRDSGKFSAVSPCLESPEFSSLLKKALERRAAKESGFLRLFKIKYLGELLTVKLEGRVSL